MNIKAPLAALLDLIQCAVYSPFFIFSYLILSLSHIILVGIDLMKRESSFCNICRNDPYCERSIFLYGIPREMLQKEKEL